MTYLKNMDGWRPAQFKNMSFEKIKDVFDKVFKRVNTFINMETEVVKERSAKRASER